MKAKIVRIGNSQGIRIPKTLIEQTGLTGSVELAVENGQLVIRRGQRARSGWSEAFQNLHVHHDDVLLDPAAGTAWDRHEWEW